MKTTAIGGRFFYALMFFCALANFSGCSSLPAESAPHTDESGTAEGTVTSGAEDNSKQDKQGLPPQAPVVARELPKQPAELEAVTYLLDQAQLALDNADADKANALSTRALKIDRKSPRAYLVLAESYLVQKKRALARSTAKQGLLYAAKNSVIGRQLQQLAK